MKASHGNATSKPIENKSHEWLDHLVLIPFIWWRPYEKPLTSNLKLMVLNDSLLNPYETLNSHQTSTNFDREKSSLNPWNSSFGTAHGTGDEQPKCHGHWNRRCNTWRYGYGSSHWDSNHCIGWSDGQAHFNPSPYQQEHGDIYKIWYCNIFMGYSWNIGPYWSISSDDKMDGNGTSTSNYKGFSSKHINYPQVG